MTLNYTKINLSGKVLVARLTVECHKFLNGLFYKRTTREPLRTTLAPSSLFRVGKVLLTDYHKLHLPVPIYP